MHVPGVVVCLVFSDNNIRLRADALDKDNFWYPFFFIQLEMNKVDMNYELSEPVIVFCIS